MEGVTEGLHTHTRCGGTALVSLLQALGWRRESRGCTAPKYICLPQLLGRRMAEPQWEGGKEPNAPTSKLSKATRLSVGFYYAAIACVVNSRQGM